MKGPNGAVKIEVALYQDKSCAGTKIARNKMYYSLQFVGWNNVAFNVKEKLTTFFLF